MALAVYTGGARIGWVNASWPLARLAVDPDRLTLTSLGRYDFTPSQVVALERHGTVPVFYSGVRIHHNRPDYPEKIIFWYLGDVPDLLARIGQDGFTPCGGPGTRAAGFPVRWSAAILVVAVWNALFLADAYQRGLPHGQPGGLSVLALLLLFALSTTVQVSPAVQGLVLRDGHRIGEIKSFAVLLQIISGIMSLAFGIFWVTLRS